MSHNNRYPAQTLLEFALILPLFLLLLVGFFDLGRAFLYNSSLSNAIREATRSGIVMYDDADTSVEEGVKEKVLEYAFGLTSTTIPLTKENIVVIITYDSDEYKDMLHVTANYCFVPITPMIATIVGNHCEGGGNGIQLTAESKMQFEPGFK